MLYASIRIHSMVSRGALKAWWKRNEADTVSAAVFVLVAVSAFLGGRISVISRDAEPIVIEVPESAMREQERLQQDGLANLALSDTQSTQGIPETDRRGEYVASKNGDYYYTADMYLALRIKEANRIWFASRKDAEAKGLKPAKGLQ